MVLFDRIINHLTKGNIMNHDYYTKMVFIELDTANNWLKQGTIKITYIGEENTYYLDEFGTTFVCKTNH